MAEGERVHVVGMVPAVRSSPEVAIWFFDRAQDTHGTNTPDFQVILRTLP